MTRKLHRYREDTYRIQAERMGKCVHCRAEAGRPCVTSAGKVAAPNKWRREDAEQEQ